MPKNKATLLIAGVMLASCAAASRLEAFEAPTNYGLKVRAGATAGNLHEDMNRNETLSFSLTADFAKVGKGALFGEFGFYYYGGMNKATAFGSSKGTGTAVPSGTLYAETSADMRKNQMQGFGLRAGYRAPLGWGWDWQAGMSLDSLRYSQEAVGQLQVTVNKVNVIESFAVTPHTNKMNVGAFAGVQRALNDDVTFEVNVATVGYSSINYVPKTYTGAAAAQTETKTRRGFQLEFGFGMRF